MKQLFSKKLSVERLSKITFKDVLTSFFKLLFKLFLAFFSGIILLAMAIELTIQASIFLATYVGITNTEPPITLLIIWVTVSLLLAGVILISLYKLISYIWGKIFNKKSVRKEYIDG